MNATTSELTGLFGRIRGRHFIENIRDINGIIADKMNSNNFSKLIHSRNLTDGFLFA